LRRSPSEAHAPPAKDEPKICYSIVGVR
jgi:hypothetical protein